MRQIRAITLDLDDTLWEIEPVIRRAEAELWKWLGDHYPRVTERWSSPGTIALRGEIAAKVPHREHDFRYLRRKVLETIAIDSGYDESMVDPAFEVFDAARNTVELFPEVVPALEALNAKFVLIAVTNGNANLERIGIRHLFHGVVTAVDAGAPKPAKAIFAAAVDHAGVAPRQVLHVGDHPEIDVAGAQDAGLHAVWVNRNGSNWPGHLREPDGEVRNVAELEPLLAAARYGEAAK